MRKGLGRRGFLKAGAAAGAAAALGAGRRARAARLNPAYAIPEGPLTADDYADLLERTRAVYEQNRVTADGYTFHVPSKGKYNSLFG
ncbi:MAG TPA: twin-arginine translocation signal domain-containing protein [bacterium]|nr:twin-arginine translocation signal domain-containing protein [bacterium]